MTEMLLQAAYVTKKKLLNELKKADIKIYLETEGLQIDTTYLTELNETYDAREFQQKAEDLAKEYSGWATQYMDTERTHWVENNMLFKGIKVGQNMSKLSKIKTNIGSLEHSNSE